MNVYHGLQCIYVHIGAAQNINSQKKSVADYVYKTVAETPVL